MVQGRTTSVGIRKVAMPFPKIARNWTVPLGNSMWVRRWTVKSSTLAVYKYPSHEHGDPL